MNWRILLKVKTWRYLLSQYFYAQGEGYERASVFWGDNEYLAVGNLCAALALFCYSVADAVKE